MKTTALFASLAIAGVAMAATTEPTLYAFTPGAGLGASFATATVSWTGVSVSLPQFDTLGGTRTLTGVALSYDLYVTVDQAAENNADEARSQTISTFVSGNIKLGLTTVLSIAPVEYQNLTGTLAASDNGGTANNSGPDFIDFAVTTANQSNTGNFVGSLVPFIGGGTVSFDTAATALTAADLNNWSITSTALGNARVGVAYTWEPTEIQVPEASTYAAAFGLVGLVGFGWVRSRS
jgi:hypothetical protein